MKISVAFAWGIYQKRHQIDLVWRRTCKAEYFTYLASNPSESWITAKRRSKDKVLGGLYSNAAHFFYFVRQSQVPLPNIAILNGLKTSICLTDLIFDIYLTFCFISMRRIWKFFWADCIFARLKIITKCKTV